MVGLGARLRRHRFAQMLSGAALGLALALAPVGAQAQDVPRNETLILDSTLERIATPENYNPFLPTTTLQGGLHQVAFESLFYLNLETGELMPWQAESYAFNDTFDEVTIKLRDGVKWSDGVPFTADDVVFTMNMLKENSANLGNWGGNAKTWVKDIVAVDPLTVKITLTATNPSYVTNIFGSRVYWTNQIVPKHIWEGKDPATFTNYDPAQGWPVSTSPYQLVSANNQETVWARRDNWWGAETGFQKLPAPKRVIFTSAGNEERRTAMLINNELDTAYAIGKSSFETVHQRNPQVVTWFKEMPYAYTDAGPRIIGFNNAIPPFDNPLVRRAVSQAVNRDAIVDVAWEGMSRPISFPAPSLAALKPFFEGDEDLFEKYPNTVFDPKATEALMTEAGYTKGSDGFWADASGNKLVVDLVARQTEADSAKAAPVVAELLKRAGFDAQFRLVDSAGFADQVFTGKANIWLAQINGGVNNPYPSFDMFHSRHALEIGKSATGSYSRYANPEYDMIVEEMGKLSTDDPKFHDIVRQALEIWLRDLPVAPTTDSALLASYNHTYWKNWPTSDNPYFQPCFWWASALVSIVAIEPAT